MNLAIVTGRCTKETSLNKSGKMAFNTLAVDDVLKDADGKRTTSFINLKILGEKASQNASKYWNKGTKLIVKGSLDFKSEKKDNEYKQYDYILVDSWEFAESKGNSSNNDTSNANVDADGFLNVPTGTSEDLPFN